jgi:hypothetical protein
MKSYTALFIVVVIAIAAVIILRWGPETSATGLDNSPAIASAEPKLTQQEINDLGESVSGRSISTAVNSTVVSTNNRALVEKPSLRLSTNQPAQISSNRFVRVDFSNPEKSPLVCPNTWMFEIKRSGITVLPLTAGDVRVGANGEITIDVPVPVTSKTWRLGANYYVENVSFDIKTKVAASAIKDYVPQGLTAVSGETAWTDWVVER